MNPERYTSSRWAHEVAEFYRECLNSDAMHQHDLPRVSGCHPYSDLASRDGNALIKRGRKYGVFDILIV